MKQISKILLMVAVLLFAAACQKDNLDGIENPVKAGDEIGFGTVLPENIQSRTIYGDPDAVNRVFPVYWENGDEIAIYCPQSPNVNLVNYVIGVSGKQQNIAESVTKVGDVGLQWSAKDDLHKFYGFYPASKVLGTETAGLFHMNVPVNQQPLKYEQDDSGNWKAVVDMNNAIMYAYRGQKRTNTPVGKPIDLRFTPLATILEIVINGPSEANTDPLTLTNINVRTTNNTSIVGDFTAQVIPGSDEEETSSGSVTCMVDNDGKVDNNLSIPCTWQEGGVTNYVKLYKGQQLFVKAFLIPTTGNNLNSENIVISISTTKGTVRKTLNGSNKFEIIPHAVNRVIMPNLPNSYNVNYWMSSLDPNIYLTELSIPGSKYTTTYEYQPTTIEQQFKDGVRAFTTEFNYNNPNNFKSFISNIANYLKSAEAALGENSNEFAIVIPTFGGAGLDEKTWVTSLQDVVDEMSSLSSEYRISTAKITPESTIEDVKGSIIIKANTNDGTRGNEMVTTNAKAPILYSLWKGAYGPTMSDGRNYQDVYGGMPLYWQNYGGFNENSAGNTELRWYYQEVTHVNESGEGAESSYSAKVDAIKKQFKMGVDLYNEGTHNTWLMNDIGGKHLGQSDGVGYMAEHLNQLCLDELLSREQNAGMGLIFMNYANRGNTGVKYQSDKILQTIIDNNFKFALRKK